MGRICLGFFLGKIVTYMCMSLIIYVVKFYGRGWSVFICGLAWFLLYLSHNHVTRSSVRVVIYEPL